jgi:hypothetical protein
MVPGEGAFACLRFGHGDAVSGRELRQRVASPCIVNAAARDQERTLRA